MRPAIRALISPDAQDLHGYRPDDPTCFGLFIQLLAGPEGEPGEESFDFTVCTGAWLSLKAAEGPFIARHNVVVSEYDWPAIQSFLERFVRSCEGTNSSSSGSGS